MKSVNKNSNKHIHTPTNAHAHAHTQSVHMLITIICISSCPPGFDGDRCQHDLCYARCVNGGTCKVVTSAPGANSSTTHTMCRLVAPGLVLLIIYFSLPKYSYLVDPVFCNITTGIIHSCCFPLICCFQELSWCKPQCQDSNFTTCAFCLFQQKLG